MKRIPSLDGLRAISISLVCIGHLTHAGPVPKFLTPYSLTGVRIFFVISGYLITTILLAERSQTSTIDLRQFYIHRAYRILPEKKGADRGLRGYELRRGIPCTG